MNAITIRDLHKQYGNTQALSGATLTVPKGSFYGLLGPNGAGKTTLIHSMCGLANYDSGTIKVLGHDVTNDYRDARRAVGLSQQDIHMDLYFTVFEVLINQAGYYGVPAKTAKKRAQELLTMFGVWQKKDQYHRDLSGGMKRKIEIAKALMHKPKVLILDEPTAGIDVQSRKSLWKQLRALNRKGLTILLTTHYIEEAQELCDTIAIINNGRVLTEKPTGELITRLGRKILTATYTDTPTTIPNATRTKNTLHITLTKEDDEQDILKALLHAGTLKELTTRQQRLEDVFLELVGDEL